MGGVERGSTHLLRSLLPGEEAPSTWENSCVPAGHRGLREGRAACGPCAPRARLPVSRTLSAGQQRPWLPRTLDREGAAFSEVRGTKDLAWVFWPALCPVGASGYSEHEGREGRGVARPLLGPPWHRPARGCGPTWAGSEQGPLTAAQELVPHGQRKAECVLATRWDMAGLWHGGKR